MPDLHRIPGAHASDECLKDATATPMNEAHSVDTNEDDFADVLAAIRLDMVPNLAATIRRDLQPDQQQTMHKGATENLLLVRFTSSIHLCSTMVFAGFFRFPQRVLLSNSTFCSESIEV